MLWHTTVTRSSKSAFSSTSAPASNIRAQSAFFNAGLFIYVRKRRRRYSTGAGVLEAIIVTLIAGALRVVSHFIRVRSHRR
jgi:hypothetical protein